MPSFQDNHDLATEVLRHNPKQTIYIQGAPGNGKTALASAVFNSLGINKSHQIIFRPSLRDPVDLMGVPYVVDNVTRFAPSELIHRMRTGKFGLCIDELPQSTIMMQNALAGLMLDRMIDELKLSDDVYIIATGNRVQDKAGANKMLTQLSNRVMYLDQESNLDGWTEWALGAGVPLWLISFLRFKPALLNSFDATRPNNPTERSWEMVGKLPDMKHMFMYTAMSGLVGAGAAAEAIGFKKIADSLPSIESILLDPLHAKVPTDPATLYAISGAIAHRATKDNFESVMAYTNRLPPEFGVLVVRDSYRIAPAVSSTRPFIEWATANGSIFI